MSTKNNIITVTRIEMADDHNLYTLAFGPILSIIEDDGDFIITETGDVDGELFRTPNRAEAQQNLIRFAIDDDLVVAGFGIHSGRKFWQLPEALKAEILFRATLPTEIPENKTVTVPACVQHEGYYALRVTLRWVCPVCGGPRGEPFDGISYDGSRRLAVHHWHNACGHVDKYSAMREEAAVNGLNLISEKTS